MRFRLIKSFRWFWKVLFVFGVITSFLTAVKLLARPSAIRIRDMSGNLSENKAARQSLQQGDVVVPKTSLAGSAGDVPRSDQTKPARPKGCVPPKLDPFDPVVLQFHKKGTKVDCSSAMKDWVFVSNGTFRISPEAQQQYGNIECEYIPVTRVSDFKTGEGRHIKPMPDGAALTSDFFKVECRSDKGKTYSGVHSGIAVDHTIHKRLADYAADAKKREENAKGLGLNVFMFGFDSTSRMSWIRNLPRTREYYLKTMGGIELEGYNIVGDGTPAALLPILTGKVEEELPEARRAHVGAQQLDGHPWVWKDYKRHGYVTAHAEDMAFIGTFQLRMLGFKDPPTDHSMRPYYQTVESLYKQHSQHCLGSTPRHINFLNWFRDLFDMYHDHPKIFFGFHSEFSHGNGHKLQAMDDDLLAFLQDLERKGYLNNTLLILMADHGARFHDLRVTKQGNLEERMPYFSFRFPSWFRQKHPEVMRNFEINSKRLTTPFDIHATFMEILDYTGPGLANISQRGLSLFKEIPEERTCSDAGIAPHWCACLDWQAVDPSDANVQKAVQTAVDTINSYTAKSRSYCAELTLDKITASAKYITSEREHKAEQTMRDYLAKDKIQKEVVNEYILTYSGKAELYQVTFFTQPGNGQFEVTCSLDVTSGKFTINANAISRLNRYGSAPACIEKRTPHLRPYCYCKK